MSITTKTVAFTWDVTFTLELKHSHFLHLHFNINPIASYHLYFIFRFIYFLYFFWILKYEATTPRISTISAKVMNTKIDESSMQNNAKTHASSNIRAVAIHKIRDCKIVSFYVIYNWSFVKIEETYCFCFFTSIHTNHQKDKSWNATNN